MHTTTENIRQALKADGYRNKDIAIRLHLSEAQASRILNGKSTPTMIQLKTLSDLAGVKLAPMFTEESPWLNVREAAARARRHPETIRRAIKGGDLPARQRSAGGHWRVRAAHVDQWIERGWA